MAFEIIDYFSCSNKDYWIEEIGLGQWEACHYLSTLLLNDKLKDLCGENTKLFLLTENYKLYSFCTLAEQDEIRAPNMTPWIGFVYTFPPYRGQGYGSKIIKHACIQAKSMGYEKVYTSPSNDTMEFYDKFGFTRLDYPMTTIYGYETSVYYKDL